jgi:hypothetical protein
MRRQRLSPKDAISDALLASDDVSEEDWWQEFLLVLRQHGYRIVHKDDAPMTSWSGCRWRIQLHSPR